MCNACVRTFILLYGGATLIPNDLDLQGLQHSNLLMLRWIIGENDMDGISSEDLLAILHLFDTTVELRTRRLRWLRHVEHFDDLSSVMDIALQRTRERGRSLNTFEG